MSDQTEDFNKDFTEKYSAIDLDSVWSLIDSVLQDDKSLSKGNWDSSFSKEKHDALNYTYHISLNKIDNEDECAELSFYTGINVGCELVDYSLEGASLAYEPMMQSVLYDLELDLSRIGKNVSVTIAQAVLRVKKEEILEIYRKQSYDNYVTGGGTVVTDRHYKDKFDRFNKMGLYWNCLYKEVEVDRNIVLPPI
jgi:hypothetical protein